jgi:hypothetical protein
MAETSFAAISKVLGWKLSEDKTRVLSGFEQPDGNQFALGITQLDLIEVIMSLVGATEEFPPWEVIGLSSAKWTETRIFFCAYGL